MTKIESTGAETALREQAPDSKIERAGKSVEQGAVELTLFCKPSKSCLQRTGATRKVECGEWGVFFPPSRLAQRRPFPFAKRDYHAAAARARC